MKLTWFIYRDSVYERAHDEDDDYQRDHHVCGDEREQSCAHGDALVRDDLGDERDRP